jgi:hypothetical protein
MEEIIPLFFVADKKKQDERSREHGFDSSAIEFLSAFE